MTLKSLQYRENHMCFAFTNRLTATVVYGFYKLLVRARIYRPAAATVQSIVSLIYDPYCISVRGTKGLSLYCEYSERLGVCSQYFAKGIG